MSTTQQLFNAAYWASLPTPVQALNNTSLSSAQKIALFDSLIAQGFGAYLLVVLDLWGYDPYTWFADMSAMGFTWQAPATAIQLGQTGQYAIPGTIPQPGSLGTYPVVPPAGAPSVVIPPMAQLVATGANVTALLAQWFPPYNAPKPAPSAPTDPVGLAIAPGSIYYLNAPGVDQSNWPNGSEYSDSRGSFVHIVVATPFGNESQWMLVAATA